MDTTSVTDTGRTPEGNQPKPSKQNPEGLYLTLQEWVQADIAHSSKWRARAHREFGFAVDSPSGGQYSEEDKSALKEQDRPAIVFNQTLKFIRAVAGIQVNNRQSTAFLPRDVTDEGEVKANEMLTAASEWMDHGSNAQRQKSQAFRDLLMCGMGWCESLMEFDADPRGEYVVDRIDPREMGWDHDARAQNLSDSRRRWRVRQMALSEAQDLLPGITDAKDLLPSDLDATWASDVNDAKDPLPKTQERKEMREENQTGYDPKRKVTIVQVQWWEYEPYRRVANPELLINPQAERTIDVSEEEYRQIAKKAPEGTEWPATDTLRRKVYKQAIIGGKVLHSGPGPRPDGFTLHCMTGEADDNEGTWFGMVRGLAPVQEWSNKFFSQLMHIINATAKGGILAEKDAFDDVRAAQANYAKPNAITVMAAGAISKGKVMAKPGTGVTAGVLQLLEIANGAFGNVTGINLELLGLADRDQPGVLEAQRKQAAMTILATMFDSLTLFEMERGQTKLHFIQTHLADGRLIRIYGESGHEAIALIKDKMLGRFDVIVDDAPSSPDVKERAWAGLQLVLPAFQGLMSPKLAAMIVDFVPYLPTKLVEGLKAIALEPDPGAQEQGQIAKADALAEIEGKKSKSLRDKAGAVLDLAKAGEVQAKEDHTRWQSVLDTLGFGKPKEGTGDASEQVLGSEGAQLPTLPELGSSGPGQPITIDEIAETLPGVVPPGGIGPNGGGQ